MLAVCHEGILMLLVIPSCHLVMEMAWYLQLDKKSCLLPKHFLAKNKFIIVEKVRLCMKTQRLINFIASV